MESLQQTPQGGIRNVIAISCAFFFIFLGFGTAQQYLVILFKQQGRGDLALVSLLLIYAAFMLMGILISSAVPLIGGLRRSLLIGALTYVLFILSLAAGNIPLLLFSSVTVGIGAGLLWITSAQIIVDSSAPHTVGRNLGIQQIGQYCGNILGIYAGGYMAQAFSREHMYLVLTGAAAIGFLVIFAVRPMREELKPRPFKPYFAFDRRMLAIFPLIFGSSYLQAQVFTAMNLVIVALLGIGSVPLLISIVKVSNIAGSFGSGTMSDWTNKYGLLIGLILIALVGTLVFTQAHTLPLLFVAAILLGFSMASMYPVFLSLLKEAVAADEYLYALGIFSFYGNIAVLSAIAANLWLPASTSFIPGAVALIIAVPCIFVFRGLIGARSI